MYSYNFSFYTHTSNIFSYFLIKSVEIADAAYDCDWYKLKPKEIMDLTMIMNNAQAPFEVTAGKFRALSIKLFADVSY